MSFFRDLGRFGDAPALLAPDTAPLTYRELSELVQDWRQRLARHVSVERPRLLVAIELQPHADMVAAYLAALQDGHAVLVSAPGTLDHGQRTAVIYHPDLTLCWRQGRCETMASDLRALDVPHPDLRLLLSTSGSTGDPRLVRLSETNIASNATSIAEYLELDPDDVGITSLPLHYSYGLSVLHSHLEVGAALVLTDLSVAEPAFAELCRQMRVSMLALVPHQVDLLAARRFDFSSLPTLRKVTQAGGRLAVEKVRDMAGMGARQGWSFVVMYGQTEAAPRMAYLPASEAAANPDTIGRAIPGGHLWVEGADGAEITATGVAGELVYEGPNVMMGYADSRADLTLGQGSTRLRTGDMAERTAAGYFRLVGRAKRFVKLYGLRINLDQIDRALETAGLSGLAVGVGDNLVVMTTDQGGHAKIRTLVADMCDLPEAAVTVLAMVDVPRLANGKTDLREVAERARRAFTITERTATAGSLLEDFRQATRRTKLNLTDSFNRIGGDSLSYLHVMLAIEARIGHVPPKWEEMSIEALDRLAGDGSAPVRVQPTATVESAVLVRLMAICCVVLFHLTLWPLVGGTWLLILLTGYSMARFQREGLARGAVGEFLRNLLWPALPLYFAIIVLFGLVREEVPASMYFLQANMVREDLPDLLSPYWFISLYVQLALFVAFCALWPAVRRAMGNSPYTFGLVATLLSVGSAALIQYGVMRCTGMDCEAVARSLPILERSVPLCLPFLFAGWTIQCARGIGQRAQAALALFLAVAVFPIREPGFLTMMMIGSVLLLLPLPISLPVRVARLLRRLAAATLFVYLTHNGVIWFFRYATPLYDTLGPLGSALVAVPLCFALAMAADWIFRRTEVLGRNQLTRLIPSRRSDA